MNDEQPATPQPAEPVACPIGIAPEASMFCSAGYCDVCVARRAATPQQPAAAAQRQIQRRADGWTSDDDGLSWRHPAPNAAAQVVFAGLQTAGMATTRQPATDGPATPDSPAPQSVNPVAWLWTGRNGLQAFVTMPPPSMLADPRCQPLYVAQQPAAASAGASELVKAKKLLRDFFQDDVGYYRSRELMAEVASCIDAALQSQPVQAVSEASCQRCKGAIENCNGDDCDGTGKHQSHWRANEPVFEVGLGWLKDARMYPRGTLLYAAPPVAIAAVSDWQPIETAPRDGTYVLASNPASSGAWIAAYQPVAVSGYRFDDPWRSCMLNHYHLDAAGRYLTPTHWKPLPTPPGAAVATAQQSEALFLVCAGGDAYSSEIVPESKLDDAYLLTQWGSLADIDAEERRVALEHFHDADEWTYIDPLRGGKDRIAVEFSVSFEDGWVRVIRLPAHPAAGEATEQM